MRSRFSKWWPGGAALFVSFAFLMLAVALAEEPINPSIAFLIGSFWLLLSACTAALFRLVSDKERDE